MALGWVVMLALLGFCSGTMGGPTSPRHFPQKTGEGFVSPAERFEQKAQQTLVLGRSI